MLKNILFVALCAILPFGAFAAKIEVASSSYVEQQLKTTVALTGDQSISGTKTYVASPIVPTPALPEA